MKKILFLVCSFSFLGSTAVSAQKPVVEASKEIKNVETKVVQPTRAPKSEVKLVPTQKIVKVRKLDATRQVKSSQVQPTVVPARSREEEK